MAGQRSNNQGLRVLDEFVCDAVSEPAPASSETAGRGVNGGIQPLPEIVQTPEPLAADHALQDRHSHRDEQLAAMPPLPLPDLPADTRPLPSEEHLRRRQQRPLAVMGIVENGVVRPLDPQVKLPEQSRVIIVAAEPA